VDDRGADSERVHLSHHKPVAPFTQTEAGILLKISTQKSIAPGELDCHVGETGGSR